jgi:putative endonuclease
MAFGDPSEAVTRAKSVRLRGLALQWLHEHPGSYSALRFDVVSVLRPPSGPARVRHVTDAF